MWINTYFDEDLRKNGIDANHYLCCIETKIFLNELNGITNLSITDLADNLLKSLQKSGLDKTPCIFITHSMGGLILKEMIKAGLNTEQIKGVVFFSTPHLGTDIFTQIAVAVSKRLIPIYKMANTEICQYSVYDEDKIDYISQFNVTKACHQICKSDFSYFKILQDVFESKNIPNFCFIENRKSFIFETNTFEDIVSESSAKISKEKEFNIHTKNKFHHDIQKFTSKDDEDYQTFKSIILNLKI